MINREDIEKVAEYMPEVKWLLYEDRAVIEASNDLYGYGVILKRPHYSLDEYSVKIEKTTDDVKIPLFYNANSEYIHMHNSFKLFVEELINATSDKEFMSHMTHTFRLNFQTYAIFLTPYRIYFAIDDDMKFKPNASRYKNWKDPSVSGIIDRIVAKYFGVQDTTNMSRQQVDNLTPEEQILIKAYKVFTSTMDKTYSTTIPSPHRIPLVISEIIKNDIRKENPAISPEIAVEYFVAIDRRDYPHRFFQYFRSDKKVKVVLSPLIQHGSDLYNEMISKVARVIAMNNNGY